VYLARATHGIGMSSNDEDHPLNLPAAVLGLLLPGAGQISLGHLKRGLLAMAGVLGLFLGGILIGGVDCVDRKEDRLWFYLQACTGPIAFAADWVNDSYLRSGAVGELVPTPPASTVNRGPDPRVSSLKGITYANEIGTLYCALAGLLNLVVILDAVTRPPREFEEPTR